MKKQFLMGFAACSMFASLPLAAQSVDTTLKNKYEREVIMLEGNKSKYCKNHEFKRIGFFGNKLEKEFENVSPESKEELKAYRRHKRRGAILLISGGVGLVAVAAVAPVIALPVFLGAFGASGGAYSVGIANVFSSNRHLQKAVWLRNRDVLAKE